MADENNLNPGMEGNVQPPDYGDVPPPPPIGGDDAGITIQPDSSAPQPTPESVQPPMNPEPVQQPVQPAVEQSQPMPELAQPTPEPVVQAGLETVPPVQEVQTQPVAEQTETTPEKPAKKKRSKFMLFALLGVLVIVLAIIGVGILLFLNRDSEATNPLFQALGISAPSIMTFVLLVAMIVLGIFALAALIGFLISLFKMLSAKKDEKKKKKKSLLSTILSFFLLVVFAVGLAFAATNLSKFSGGPVDQEYIITDPEVTTGLTTPVEIEFDASQLPINTAEYEIIGYVWNFGDGERGTGPNVTHTFTSKPDDGVYTVMLTVQLQNLTDTSGGIETVEFQKIVAIENESVAAVFNYEPQEGRAPLEVSFDASGSVDPDGQIVSYEWDFDGDGEFEGEGETTSHIFEESGEFEVTLRVLDSNGEFTEISETVNVKSEDIIQAVITLDPADEILVPDRAYQFDASGSTSDEGEIISYEWIFGDGSRGEGRRFTHSYDLEGVYGLTLVLEDEAGNVREFEQDVRVSTSSSGLFADIQTVPEITGDELVGTVPFKVNFDAGGSSGGDIVDYEWDFDNDGQADATGETTEFTFDKIGEYDVYLTITSTEGKSATEIIKVVAESAGLQARITANPSSGVVPLTVTFDASSSRVPDNVEIVSFVWDFDDGTPISREGSRVTHRYSQIGTFKPTLRLITSDDDFVETETVINVNSIPLKACFAMSRKLGPAPLIVSFNPSCTTGTVQTYTWSFGDEGVSNKRKPVFTFEDPGEYIVELEVVDSDNNVSTFEDTVIVE